MSIEGAANLVAIETATELVGVAVRTAAGVEAVLSCTGRRRHVETLVPALEHLLAQVGLEPGDIDAVAVDLGPGLFTGLRVGVASAKGLAQALGLGVLGFTSLQILARAAADLGHQGAIAAVVDARRGEVFAALHQVGTDGTKLVLSGLFSPEELAATLAEHGGAEHGGVPVLCVGDGAQRYAATLEARPGIHCLLGGLAAPPPLTLLSMADEALARGEVPLAPNEVAPEYVRQSDARVNFARVPGAVSHPEEALELRIEKLRRRDLRDVLRIETAVFPEPWSVGVFHSELALRHGRLYRAAWLGHDLAGYVGFMMVDDEAHITTIATAPACQRRGVARRLLIDGIETLLPTGVRHLSLEVAAGNVRAQALYRRFGFAPVGVRKNYYQLTGEDALVMWAHGIDTPEYARRLEDLAP